MLSHEGVVIELRVSRVDAINLLLLPRTEDLGGVKTPRPRQQTLPTKDFVQTRNAAAKPVRRIEQNRIAIRNRNRMRQDILGPKAE